MTMTNYERTLKRRRRLRAESLCVDCGQVKVKDSHRCPSCRKKQCEGERARARRWKLEGKCSGCGHEPREGKTRCAKCQEKLNEMAREKRNGWRALGICVDCNSVLTEKYRCPNCSAKKVAQARARRRKKEMGPIPTPPTPGRIFWDGVESLGTINGLVKMDY